MMMNAFQVRESQRGTASTASTARSKMSALLGAAAAGVGANPTATPQHVMLFVFTTLEGTNKAETGERIQLEAAAKPATGARHFQFREQVEWAS